MSLGLERGRIVAIQNLLIAALPALSAQLALDPITLPYKVTAADIRRGDLLRPWELDTRGDYVKICVSAGEWRNGIDAITDRAYIEPTPTSGFRSTFATSIFVYFHPDAFRMEDVFAEGELREDVQNTFAMWLRQTLNAWRSQFDNAQDIEIDSYEFGGEMGGGDRLTMCRCVNVAKAVFSRGPDGSYQLYGLQATHTGVIL